MGFERVHNPSAGQTRSGNTAEALAPGRASNTARLMSPQHPVVSGLIQRKASEGGDAPDAPDRAVAAASATSGASLPGAIMRKFESSLGTDLSGVRVHTGAESHTAAEAVGAKAYTSGQDIHFAGRYDPASPANEHLLAHEVAHTVQQRGGAPARQHKLEVSAPTDGFEVEADRAADAMVSAAPVSGLSGLGGQIQRVPEPAAAAPTGVAPTGGAPAAPATEQPIASGIGMLADGKDTAPIYGTADDKGAPVAQLTKGQQVKLTSQAGAFYGVELGAQKGYMKQGDLTTAVDGIPPEEMAQWEAKVKAASAAIDAAGHKLGAAVRGTGTAPASGGAAFPQWFMELQNKLMLMDDWHPEEEAAQQVLRDYAARYVNANGGKVPPNVASLIDYLGRGEKSSSSAQKAHDKGTGHFGGTGKDSKNWCTQTTSIGVLDGLRSLGYAPQDSATWFEKVLFAKIGGSALKIGAPQAYGAQLHPGDQVMYLFDGCQYGGHTVTVLDDLGDSFTHVSGNTGDGVGVGAGQATRLKGSPTPKGTETFNLYRCNQVGSAQEMTDSTAFIAKFDFGGAKLVYSIVRYGAMFQELEALSSLDPDKQSGEEAALLSKLKLRKVARPTVTV
jgi:hypothetical protein